MSDHPATSSELLASLRSWREDRGLVQAEAARRMGSSQPVVARLEGGGRDPRLSTVQRYAQALGGQLVLRPSGRGDIGDDVGEALAAAGVTEAFRNVVQFTDDVRRDPQLFSIDLRTEPRTTGSRRWDALLAGVTEMVARESGVDVPSWTAAPSRFLDQVWFVVEDILGRPVPGLAVHAFATTPAELSVRGVMVDRASLASV